MATSTRSTGPRPAKDEWGVYDPQQAGLAALFARLDTKDSNAKPAAPKPVDRKDAPTPKTK
jgi:hypothetical protein